MSDQPSTGQGTGQDAGGSGGMSKTQVAVQTVGFVIGLGLLAWALKLAFNAENRAQFEKLGDAAWYEVGGLVALGLGTLFFNGLIFWNALLPVKRLGVVEVQATNAIASLLSYLPFKLSLLFRTVVHNRRDGVPIFTMGSWFGAIGVMMLTVLIPLAGISRWRQDIDLVWFVLVLVGVAACVAVTGYVASLFSFGKGLERFRRLVGWFRIKPLTKFVRTDTYAKMHAGIVMLASPRALAVNVLLRFGDVAVHTVRFKVAATMLGQDLTWEQSLFCGVAFFMIGSVSPAGSIGIRETGTMGAAGLIGIEPATFAPVAIVVMASETIAYLLGTVLGVVYLNPAKLAKLNQEKPVGLDVDPETGKPVEHGSDADESADSPTIADADRAGTDQSDDRGTRADR